MNMIMDNFWYSPAALKVQDYGQKSFRRRLTLGVAEKLTIEPEDRLPFQRSQES